MLFITQVPPIRKLPGFFKLKIDNSNDGEVKAMSGSFYILESTSDVVCNIKYGSIAFVRQDNVIDA
jgi:hypothetical protein